MEYPRRGGTLLFLWRPAVVGTLLTPATEVLRVWSADCQNHSCTRSGAGGAGRAGDDRRARGPAGLRALILASAHHVVVVLEPGDFRCAQPQGAARVWAVVCGGMLAFRVVAARFGGKYRGFRSFVARFFFA